MRVNIPSVFAGRPPLNYGGSRVRLAISPHHITFCLAIAAILSLSAVQPVAAQQGFDPRQTEKHFDDVQEQSSRPARAPLQMPSFAHPETAGDGKPLFLLRGVSIVGATAIPHDQLVATYRTYLGRNVSQADLAAIAQAISDLYRAAGFHLSRAIIPPQDIADGRVRIQVIEGSITEIALKGDGAEQFGVRPLLNVVLSEYPSRLSTLERQLLLINGWPGVRITDSAIEEIGGNTGRFRLVLSLKTWHVYAWAGADNLGSASVGPWQSYATGAFNSYLTPGDTLALNLSTIANDPREVGFGRLSYDAPVGADGWRLGASALYSEVRPGDDRRLTNDNTRSETFELRSSYTAVQSQRSTLTLTAAADFSNVSESDVFGPIYNDHIRTASLTADYRLQDAFGGTNYATMSFRQGLDIFGASQFGDDFISRDGAAPNFSVLDFYFTRYQTLFDNWSAKFAMASQTASGPLYTSQQFYLGGAAFGRGYGAAEISGDNGLAGSFELRFDQRPNFRYLTGYQLYGFVDAGAVWNDGYRIGDGLALTSAGGGIRFFFWDDFQADLGVAFPLSYRAPDNTTRTARFLFSVSNALKLCPTRGTGSCL
ncbi:MAG: ShlB/FhaC/HecB family hemolysin secretion/activation protein [Bradyrhizobium sp.]|nr:ShlB/FhaC/HecB family hemolysin secretion/activation protein [Bradyrhizobium sp.]